MAGRTAVFAVLALLATLAPAVPAAAAPQPGSAGLGDRLNLGIGNGGYDVRHYELRLRYPSTDPAQTVLGDETISARATQSLSRFNLDFAGDSVGAVSVDGVPASFRWAGEELVVTPRRALRDGQRFDVRIRNFASTPTEPDYPNVFFSTPDGSGTGPQPYYAHRIYPSNDHPRDKATFTFVFDVPAETVAVANGVEVAHRIRNGRAQWVYEMREPMATEVTQLAVGGWDLARRGRHAGVSLRDLSAPRLNEFLQPAFALEPRQLDYMQSQVGRYPFSIYGMFVPDVDIGTGLESQTITYLDSIWFEFLPQGVWDPTMLHELAHMWFGDSVSPHEWSDLWLNEGHATWYELTYAEAVGELAEDTVFYPDESGYPTLEEEMRAIYAHGDQWRHDFGPVARPASGDPSELFSFNVYHGGALVLYALRQEIGPAAFKRVERAWVQRYRGESAGTQDFIALASHVAHRDLSGFLEDWLYGETTPPMPGHLDWTTDPVVDESGLTALSAAVPSRPLP